MSTEIHWIKNQRDDVVQTLCKYFPKVSVFEIENYRGGFVRIGELNNNTFKYRDFNDLNYITFQIRYIYDLYFIDFWRVESFDWGGDHYSKNWDIAHYSYIYKNGTLLRDKIKFIIDSMPGDITCFNPSYPIYELNKLKTEHFVEFKCSPKWIKWVNYYSVNDYSSQDDIGKLFNLFYTLTENKSELFYENHHLFNLK